MGLHLKAREKKNGKREYNVMSFPICRFKERPLAAIFGKISELTPQIREFYVSIGLFEKVIDFCK